MKTLGFVTACLLSIAHTSGEYTPRVLSQYHCQDISDSECALRDAEFEEQVHDRRQLAESTGTLNLLVLPISWRDRPSGRTLPTTAQLNELWRGEGSSDINPVGSISNWVEVNSHGTLTLNPIVAPWITADNTEVYYADGRAGRPQNPNGIHIYEAIEYALQQLQNQGFDFSPFDQDNNGVLDAVSVIHSGYAAEQGGQDCDNNRGFTDRIQSHYSNAPERSSGWTGPGGVRLGSYTIQSAYRNLCNANLNVMGIMVHEFVHFFGFPELYDIEKVFSGSYTFVGGLGGYDPMANAFGAINRGAWPGHLSPWSKSRLGWANPMEITADGTYTLRPSELYPEFYAISSPYPEGEYLMLEVRRPLLFDINMWQPGGMLIYHIDEKAPGPGNQKGGYPGLPGWPGNGVHYQVALLQQDGEYSLDKAEGNGGASDFWVAGTTLGPGNGENVASSATYPNTDSYQFGNIQVTGITITDFQDGPDGSVTFRVSGMPANAPAPTNPPQQSPTGGTGGTTPTAPPQQSPTGGTGGTTPTAAPQESPTDGTGGSVGNTPNSNDGSGAAESCAWSVVATVLTMLVCSLVLA